MPHGPQLTAALRTSISQSICRSRKAASALSAILRATLRDVFAAPPAHTERHQIKRAAEMLNSGKKIAIMAGQGALKAGNELERVAETLQAPIIKALLGKAAVPDDSPIPPAASACSAPRRHKMPWRTATLC